MTGDLQPILFRCDEGHLVSRGDAFRRDGELRCPRHDQPESKQQKLVTDGGQPPGAIERPEGVLVNVHEHTGEEGVIVELRPEDHEMPQNRDMERLSMDEARELHRQLSIALIREDPQSYAEQAADELMPMIPPEEIPCDFADQIDAAQSALRFAAEREPAVDLPVGDSA